jgi:hypothetical protein
LIGEYFLDRAVIKAVFSAERIEGWCNAIFGVEIVLAGGIPKFHAGVHSRSSDALWLWDAHKWERCVNATGCRQDSYKECDKFQLLELNSARCIFNFHPQECPAFVISIEILLPAQIISQ